MNSVLWCACGGNGNGCSKNRVLVTTAAEKLEWQGLPVSPVAD